MTNKYAHCDECSKERCYNCGTKISYFISNINIFSNIKLKNMGIESLISNIENLI
jgi:hypothetical protein